MAVSASAVPTSAIIRTIAYGVALELFPTTLHRHGLGQFASLPIQFREIDDAAIYLWNTRWHAFSAGHGGYDWEDTRNHYIAAYPDRFDIAVWCGPVLCGMGVGYPHDSCLTITLMEGSTDRRHPLRGVIRYAVVEAGRAYARALGKSDLRLSKPRLGLLTRYQQMGFTMAQPVQAPPYCWMKV